MICENCGNVHDGYYGSGRFCSSKCARGFSTKNNRDIINQKTSATLKNKNLKKIRYCKYCGNEKGKCLRKDLCDKHKIVPALIKHFGFNSEVIGSNLYYKELEKVILLLNQEYYENHKCLEEIAIKYNYHIENINLCTNLAKIFKSLGIITRSNSEQKQNSILNNRSNLKEIKHTPYKMQWHTTWEGKRVFLRSSYEKYFCDSLDYNKIKYDVENLKVVYWDSQRQKTRIAIPDFYLPSTNTIVEIKSRYTYDEQNMRDRLKAYLESGYKFELYIDKKRDYSLVG